MSKIPVVVSGLGPVSAIGCGCQEFWQSLVAGKHGFGPITRCDVSRSPSKIGAEVKDFQLERYVENGSIIASGSGRAMQFAFAASALALKDATIDLDNCDRDRFGVTVGTNLGSMEEAVAARDKWLATETMTSNMAFQLFNHADACMISSFFNLRGAIHTTSSGCNSGLDALGHALRLIQFGIADGMLVVATDCELHAAMLAALNASGSLATRFNDDPGRASRPFDLDRNGNVIGEGAAALLLESEPHALARGAKIYARMMGHSVCAAGEYRRYSSDRPVLDLRPCVRAFQAVMDEAGWQPDEVDLVSANGSSSVLYDRLEALALAQVFGNVFSDIRVHSIKSMLGQHGAGSSALQAVAACLSINQGVVPPTINHEKPDPGCGPIRVVTEAEPCNPQNVVTHAIGFGGFYYSCGAFAAPN